MELNPAQKPAAEPNSTPPPTTQPSLPTTPNDATGTYPHQHPNHDAGAGGGGGRGIGPSAINACHRTELLMVTLLRRDVAKVRPPVYTQRTSPVARDGAM